MLATPDTTGPCTAGGLTWISGYQSERFGEYPNGVLKRTWRVCHGRLLTGGRIHRFLRLPETHQTDILVSRAPRVYLFPRYVFCVLITALAG